MSIVAPFVPGMGAGLGMYSPYAAYASSESNDGTSIVIAMIDHLERAAAYYPSLSSYRYGAGAITTPWTRNWYGPSWGAGAYGYGTGYGYSAYGGYGGYY